MIQRHAMVHRQRRGKALVTVGALAVVMLIGWRFPLFHVVSLKQVRERQKAGVFDAAKVAAAFWDGQLVPALNHAVDASDLLSSLANDAAAAREQHGRTGGAGSSTVFLVKGGGRVLTVDADAVVVALDRVVGAGAAPKVSLSSGLVFGNAVRDVTGVLDVSTYSNSQDFNDLSTQLNSIVETRVVPALRERAAVGKIMRFVGCAELEEDAKPDTLPVIPLRIEWP